MTFGKTFGNYRPQHKYWLTSVFISKLKTGPGDLKQKNGLFASLKVEFSTFGYILESPGRNFSKSRLYIPWSSKRRVSEDETQALL